MSEQRYGGSAITQSDTVTTGAGQLKTKTESQKLAAANPNRVALIVTNIGAKTVYLGLGVAAVKEKGIALKKEGDPFILTSFSGEVTAISHEEEPLVTVAEV